MGRVLPPPSQAALLGHPTIMAWPQQALPCGFLSTAHCRWIIRGTIPGHSQKYKVAQQDWDVASSLLTRSPTSQCVQGLRPSDMGRKATFCPPPSLSSAASAPLLLSCLLFLFLLSPLPPVLWYLTLLK